MTSDTVTLDRPKVLTARMLLKLRNSNGYATVELAMTLPILALAMCLCLWVSSLGVMQIQLQSSATTAARILARGENLPAGFTDQLPNGAVLDSEFTVDSVTVNLSLDRASPLSRIPMDIELNARSVANLESNQSVSINQE